MFARTDDLKSHAKTHSDEKPFKCGAPNCNSMFKRKSDCTKHRGRCTKVPGSKGKPSKGGDKTSGTKTTKSTKKTTATKKAAKKKEVPIAKKKEPKNDKKMNI
jgi:uncharacterized Zn-finger protein